MNIDLSALNISEPALRALNGAGYIKLSDLAHIKDEQLLRLHGMGPKALLVIKEALEREKTKS